MDDIFHCFRHTFATLQLANGTDIYTVSKMLGHTNVKTTQVYAKVVDEKKNKAANAIQIDIENDKTAFEGGEKISSFLFFIQEYLLYLQTIR